MTPHPQPEFIITFEEIKFLRSAMFTHRETCANILRHVHSRLYNPQAERMTSVEVMGEIEQARQAEREKVLDEAIIKIQERINGIFEAYRDETNENITRIPYNMANGMGEAIKMIKELRSTKGGE